MGCSMIFILPLLLLLAALPTQSAPFVSTVVASNDTGRLVALTNFLQANVFAGTNISIEWTNKTGIILHNTASSGSSYQFNTNQFATNTGFSVDIKKAARITNSITRDGTNSGGALHIAAGTTIAWPFVDFEETAPNSSSLNLLGSLNVHNLDVLTNFDLPFSAVTAGQIWTLTNVASGRGSWSNFPPVLNNLNGLVDNTYTNVPKGGTNISVRTVGGTNFIDTIGELNNWSQLSTNALGLASTNAAVNLLTNKIENLNGVGTNTTLTSVTNNASATNKVVQTVVGGTGQMTNLVEWQGPQGTILG